MHEVTIYFFKIQEVSKDKADHCSGYNPRKLTGINLESNFVFSFAEIHGISGELHGHKKILLLLYDKHPITILFRNLKITA